MGVTWDALRARCVGNMASASAVCVRRRPPGGGGTGALACAPGGVAWHASLAGHALAVGLGLWLLVKGCRGKERARSRCESGPSSRGGCAALLWVWTWVWEACDGGLAGRVLASVWGVESGVKCVVL